MHSSAPSAHRIGYTQERAMLWRQTQNLCGCSSQTQYRDGNAEQHGCSLVRWGWLSPWTVNKLRRVDFFVCHGLLDPAVFLDISWDNFLSTDKLKFLGLPCVVCLQNIQAEPGALSAAGPLPGETRRNAGCGIPSHLRIVHPCRVGWLVQVLCCLENKI